MNRTVEVAATTIAGASIAALAGAGVGFAAPALAIGAINGVIAGAKRTYEWTSWRGRVAFVLDSSWSLLNTAGGIVSHIANQLDGDPDYLRALSERQNRHVYARGRTTKPGFALTLGNVVTGAGDNDTDSRTRLVVDHEDVHIWQARWLGPIYPVLYVGWSAVGGAVGAMIWVFGSREHGFNKTVETVGYYMNPLEWWAYSRQGYWPPRGMIQHLGWRQPLARSLATKRAGRRAKATGRASSATKR